MPRTAALVLAASLFPLVPSAGGQGTPDLVTVRLFDNRPISAATLIVTGGELTLHAHPDHDPVSTVAAGDSVAVIPTAIGLRVTVGGLDINQDELHARAGTDAAVDVEIVSGGQKTVRRYPGTITVSRTAEGSLRITNTVRLETYVASVVGREYGLEDVEGTRAMAVVARTFALRAMAENGGETGDGISAQVYHGLDGVSDASRAAAEATHGLVLTHDDRPIMAVYSAANGGHTAGNSDVWSGEPLTYLQARRDRFDRAASPYNDWLSRLSKSQVHGALTDLVGASVSGFSIKARSNDGRVTKLRVRLQRDEDVDISGSDFRRVLSGRFGVSALRSTLFDVSTEGEYYVFEGSGYGHGVGLSQWGAHEMADRGYNYDEILKFYYDGAKIRSIADLGFEMSERIAATDPVKRDQEAATRPADPDPGRTVAEGFGGWTARGNDPALTDAGRRVGW